MTSEHGEDSPQTSEAPIQMPRRNERRAPSFNGSGAFLPQFFRDFENIAHTNGLPEDQYLSKVLDYARVDDYDLWKQLTEETGATWDSFKKHVARFYSGADDDRRHTVSDLNRLCEAMATRQKVSRAEFSEFYRKFYTMVTYLQQHSKLLDQEVSDMLLRSFNFTLRCAVEAKLDATHPSHHPDDPYELKQLVDAIELVLAKTAREHPIGQNGSSSTLPHPSTIGNEASKLPARPTYDASGFSDPEKFGRLTDSISTAMQMLSTMMETFSVSVGNGQRSSGRNGPSNNTNSFRGCALCSDTTHFKRNCTKIEDLISKGLCKRGDRGLICLPNGDRVNQSTASGKNIIERVENWHKARQQNANPTNVVSTNIWNIVEAEGLSNDVMETEQAPVSSAFINEITNESCSVSNQVEADDLPLLEAALFQTTLKVEAAQKKVAERDGHRKPTTRSQSKNGASGTSKADQDKTSAVDSSSAIVKNTQGNPSPVVNNPTPMKNVKELVTAKRIPTEGASAATFDNVIVSKTECETVETLLAALPPPPGGNGTIVANSSESLRTMSVKLNNKLQVNAILDDGSQIIRLRRELWEKLGVPVRSDHKLTMESANTTTSDTKGLIPNLKVTIGGCDFYLQVQVVDNASYDMLLGRPFHVLTEAMVRHFKNGDATATLTDPNTGAIITVPTKARNPKQDGYVENPLSSLEQPGFKNYTRENAVNIIEISLQEEDGAVPVAEFESFKYKKVANRVKPVAALLPPQFRVERHIPSDPLADLPELPTNPPEFKPGERYTRERAEKMKINEDGLLTEEEVKLVHAFFNLSQYAFAWDESEKGIFSEDYLPPVKIATLPHAVWILKNIPIPPGLFPKIVKIIKAKMDSGVIEPSNAAYRSQWFWVLKKDGKSRRIVHNALFIPTLATLQRFRRH
ncbi:hypothetical protein H1R20_g2455, partial [Candolleomyces eurysporus]